MDIIFGAVSAEQRRADIEKRERGASQFPPVCPFCLVPSEVLAVLMLFGFCDTALEHEKNETTSERSLDNKV